VKLLVAVHDTDLSIKNFEGYTPLTFAQAILQSEPQNLALKQIYDYINRKVGQNTKITRTPMSPLNIMRVQSFDNGQSKELSPLKQTQTLGGTGDEAHSSSSSTEEVNFTLSDYL